MKLLGLWGPVFLWAEVIFYFSNIPNLKSSFSWDPFFRKAAHVFEYFVLTFWVHRAVFGSFGFSKKNKIFFTLGLVFIYALSDEAHQLFVAGRRGSAADVLIDMLGAGSFYIFYGIISGRANKNPCP